MKRQALLALPALAILIWAVLPLIQGQETLFLRDTLRVHAALKGSQAEAFAEGRLPLVLPRIAGGIPSAGNPNAVPFYPDNLLYLVAPWTWAFNAHFWLHLLLAPLAAYALGRRWGLDPAAAWATGLTYGCSGFLLSHLNFYNLIAGVALAPALIAALMGLWDEPRRRRWWLFTALCWTLLLLAGDPLIAALALAAALLAAVLRSGGERLPRRLVTLVGTLAAGTLIAAPQIVEFLRILPSSYRGLKGYSVASATAASFDLRHLLEWLVPLAFGRPDRLGDGRFWGFPFYGDLPAFYFSLYPGLLMLALVLAGLWARDPRRARGWSLGLVGIGLFFTLGRFNPLLLPLLEMSGTSPLRYPVKLWLLIALGMALLAGLGAQRVLEAGDGKPLRRPLFALLGIVATAWLWLAVAPAPAARWLRGLIPSYLDDGFVNQERLRWAGLLLLTLVLGGLYLLALRLGRKHLTVALGTMLTLHVASQLFFLAPLHAGDGAAGYREPTSPLLARLPPEAPVVHGAEGRLFGPGNLPQGQYPQPDGRWLVRRAYLEMYPAAGVLAGRRYELNLTPEGLSPFLSHAARDAIRSMNDAQRLRLLAAWGVQRLILQRPLETPARALAQELEGVELFGQRTYLYDLPTAAPEVLFTTHPHPAAAPRDALVRMLDPAFDPRIEAVLAGEVPAPASTNGDPGEDGERLTVLAKSAESLEVEIESALPGALVWQRSWLPLYRASIDDEAVALRSANLFRLAVTVPAGRHRVRLWVDRRPLRVSTAISAATLVLLLALCAVPALTGRRANRQPAPLDSPDSSGSSGSAGSSDGG